MGRKLVAQSEREKTLLRQQRDEIVRVIEDAAAKLKAQHRHQQAHALEQAAKGISEIGG